VPCRVVPKSVDHRVAERESDDPDTRRSAARDQQDRSADLADLGVQPPSHLPSVERIPSSISVHVSIVACGPKRRAPLGWARALNDR
jgi:hypothetical protein